MRSVILKQFPQTSLYR